jgi:hypothetical protein
MRSIHSAKSDHDIVAQLFFLNWYSGGWSPISSTQYCGHQWPIVLAPGDYDDEEIGGMIGRENRNTRRKPAPVPLCPPQSPHAARTRTRAAAMGSNRITARAMARPIVAPFMRFAPIHSLRFCPFR